LWRPLYENTQKQLLKKSLTTADRSFQSKEVNEPPLLIL
jgi:hypothetical protein